MVVGGVGCEEGAGSGADADGEEVEVGWDGAGAGAGSGGAEGAAIEASRLADLARRKKRLAIAAKRGK